VGPSKAIVVLLEELDECEPELCAKACPNFDFVVLIMGVDTDFVEFIYHYYKKGIPRELKTHAKSFSRGFKYYLGIW